VGGEVERPWVNSPRRKKEARIISLMLGTLFTGIIFIGDKGKVPYTRIHILGGLFWIASRGKCHRKVTISLRDKTKRDTPKGASQNVIKNRKAKS